MLNIHPDDPLAVAAVEAIRSGDLEEVKRLLRDNPSLATARIGKSRTLLHVATDWPGNFPNSAVTVAALIEGGVEVNARSTGPHTETPLHWAASCDDVAALDALLDHGDACRARRCPRRVDRAGAPLQGRSPIHPAEGSPSFHVRMTQDIHLLFR
jgi:uncharacterized protein